MYSRKLAKRGSSAFLIADEELSNIEMIFLDSSSIISSNLSIKSRLWNFAVSAIFLKLSQRKFWNYVEYPVFRETYF